MERSRRLQWALGCDLAIAAVEVVGGFLANSTGLLATAGHDIADAGALALALVATRLVTRPATATRSFGLHRVTILSALANAVAIVVVSVLVGMLAVQRLLHPPHVHGGLVVVFAAVALVGNGLAAAIVHDRSRDLNMRAATLHLAGDALAALGVLAAGAIILSTGRFDLLDPAVSLAIAVLVVVEAVILVRQSVDILLESTPADVIVHEVSQSMAEVPGITDVHDLHCWSLSSEVRALSAHVVLAGHPSLEEAQEVADQVKARLRSRHGIAHATIELECERCADPADEVCAIETAARP
ncbi:MAG: cation diffusion facilitator family transporter [Acidimicrobiales bacterium]